MANKFLQDSNGDLYVPTRELAQRKGMRLVTAGTDDGFRTVGDKAPTKPVEKQAAPQQRRVTKKKVTKKTASKSAGEGWD